MSAANTIRTSHRWISIAFTLTVVANFVAMAITTPPMWLTFLPLPPLFLLIFSGLYLFVLPYLSKKTAAPDDAARHRMQG
jgi:hypothetical protein